MTSPPESSRNWLGSLWGGAGAIAWVAGLGLLLLELWRRPQDVYSVPPIGYLIASLLVLALLGRRLSWLLWAYWAAAALTLLWSVAAGHTLLALQWELVFLAFAVAGLWRPGFWLLAVSLLVMGLDSTVLFSVFGFLAGGESLLLYQAGAEALLLVAPGLVLALNAKRPLWLRVLGGLVVAAALFVALASGARAVYLPLVVIMVLASWRLLRGGGGVWQTPGCCGCGADRSANGRRPAGAGPARDHRSAKKCTRPGARCRRVRSRPTKPQRRVAR